MSYSHGVASSFFSIFLFCFGLCASDVEDDVWAVCSPMSGRVERVLVTPGTFVERGTPLFVSEAMKMSMTITAERRGYVRDIHIAQGEMVTPLQNLISFQIDPVRQSAERAESRTLVTVSSAPEILTTLSQEGVAPTVPEHVEELPIEQPYSAPLLMARTAPVSQEAFEGFTPLANEVSFNQIPDNGHDLISDDIFLTSQNQDGGDPPTLSVVSDVQNSSMSFEPTFSAMLGALPFGAETSFHRRPRAPLSENMPRPTDLIDLASPIVFIFKNIHAVSSGMLLNRKEKSLSFRTKKASSFLAREVSLASIKKTEALSLLRDFIPESLAFHSLTKFFSSQARGAPFVQESFFEQALVILKASWSSLWFLSSQPLGTACILLAMLLSFLPSPRQVLNHFIQRQAAYARHLATPKKTPARIRIYA